MKIWYDDGNEVKSLMLNSEQARWLEAVISRDEEKTFSYKGHPIYYAGKKLTFKEFEEMVKIYNNQRQYVSFE